MLSYFQDSIFSSLKLLFQSKSQHSVVIDDSGIFQEVWGCKRFSTFNQKAPSMPIPPYDGPMQFYFRRRDKSPHSIHLIASYY